MFQLISVLMLSCTGGELVASPAPENSPRLFTGSANPDALPPDRDHAQVATYNVGRRKKNKTSTTERLSDKEQNENAKRTGSFKGTHVPVVESAIRRAKKSNKLVLVYFTGKKYKVCRKMEEEVFNTDGGKKYLNEHFVVCRIDVDKTPQIADHYAGTWFVPHFLILDETGTVVKRKTGYSSVNRFYGWLNR